MDTIKRYSNFVALLLVVTGIGLLFYTQYKLWKFDKGIDPAWAALESNSNQYDCEWLDWLEFSGGWNCECFVYVAREKRAGWSHVGVNPPCIASPESMRREIVSRGRKSSFRAVSAAILIVVLSRGLCFYYRRRHRLCTKCGYSIVHLSEPRCPECGCATKA